MCGECFGKLFPKLHESETAVYSERSSQKTKRNAFVFITTEADFGKNTFEDLKKVEGVNEVYVSHGDYDFIVKVSSESLDHLREIVYKKIKNE